MGVIMDQCKSMDAGCDAGYGFLARVPIDGSDEQASAAQRGGLALIEQGMDALKVAREALGMGRKSERSEQCAKHRLRGFTIWFLAWYHSLNI